MNQEEFDLEETLRVFTFVIDSPTETSTATLRQFRYGGGFIDWPNGEWTMLETPKSFERARKRFDDVGYRLVATREIHK